MVIDLYRSYIASFIITAIIIIVIINRENYQSLILEDQISITIIDS